MTGKIVTADGGAVTITEDAWVVLFNGGVNPSNASMVAKIEKVKVTDFSPYKVSVTVIGNGQTLTVEYDNIFVTKKGAKVKLREWVKATIDGLNTRIKQLQEVYNASLAPIGRKDPNGQDKEE